MELHLVGIGAVKHTVELCGGQSIFELSDIFSFTNGEFFVLADAVFESWVHLIDCTGQS